jgi:hypothetical protein
MLSKNKTYIALVVICLALLGIVEYIMPKPVNWKRTYSKDDKIPYGSYVVRDLLPQIFPEATIIDNYQTLYELQQDEFDASTINFLIFNDHFKPDEEETNALLKFAEEGTNFFIASHLFSGAFADTFGIQINEEVQWMPTVATKETELRSLQLFNSKFRTKEYSFKESSVENYFSKITKAYPIYLLGKRDKTWVNFVYVPYGKGGFYLHSCPMIFTNYNLLTTNNHEYISNALSYLPKDRHLIWDEYQKVGRKGAKNMFRVILNHDAFRYAWWVFLAGMALLMVFGAKRQQRIIPIMRPPQNISLEFTRTVGQLYFQHRNDKNLIEKRFTYLLEYIRTHFYINTNHYDSPDFFQDVVAKTGFEENKLKRLLALVKEVQRYDQISEEVFREINQLIEDFYQLKV